MEVVMFAVAVIAFTVLGVLWYGDEWRAPLFARDEETGEWTKARD